MTELRPTPSRLLAHRLRHDIRSGRYRLGDKLPSQRQLAACYGIAMNTAREALRLLASEGLVVAEHGRGVFVTAPFSTPEGTSPHYLTGSSLASSEEPRAAQESAEPVYAMAGQVFLHVQPQLATADRVRAWRVTSHRFVLEWSNGPTVKSVLEELLPRTDQEATDPLQGIVGLRLKRHRSNEAELIWLTVPGGEALLRRVKE